MEFKHFQAAVSRQWERMQKAGAMFRVGVTKDQLWEQYQKAFPPGTNEVFRERREHDCNCCKQFVRAVGDAVAVIDGKLETVWDVTLPEEPTYQKVAKAMAKLVKAATITDPFLHYERKAGTERSFDEHISGKAWNHFFVNIKPDFVMDKSAIPTMLNTKRTAHALFARALETITDDALDTVIDLIAQGSLYRGAENKFVVTEFKKLKTQYDDLMLVDATEAGLWAWKTAAAKDTAGSVTGIRNTSIGTLLVDLSEGTDLEVAVAKFEDKVHGSKYKRPTALVTPAMVSKAKAAVAELGLTSALARRYATLRDFSVNNVLWADRSAKKIMSGDVFDDLAAAAPVKSKSLDKVEEVTIAKFLADILPKAESIEVLFESNLQSNLVSLIGPTDATAGKLFKWDNPFSWSYNGEVADAIKERVKAAGGRVEGDLCCRLAWDNTDDLDFHMIEPNGGHIYFPTRRRLSMHGGILDVDANGADGRREDPVENIVYEKSSKMGDGVYELQVNHYSGTASRSKPGFTVQVEYMGKLMVFHYPKATKSGDTITVLRFKHTKAAGLEIIQSLEFTGASAPGKEVWGIATQAWHRVNVALLSPNYWDDARLPHQGNLHYFFMLDGCKNDAEARGFYNEFLDSRLDPHRKTMELVGSKLKPAPASDQLSGLGFSSTQRNTLTCRVKGSFNRTVKVTF